MRGVRMGMGMGMRGERNRITLVWSGEQQQVVGKALRGIGVQAVVEVEVEAMLSLTRPGRGSYGVGL